MKVPKNSLKIESHIINTVGDRPLLFSLYNELSDFGFLQYRPHARTKTYILFLKLFTFNKAATQALTEKRNYNANICMPLAVMRICKIVKENSLNVKQTSTINFI